MKNSFRRSVQSFRRRFSATATDGAKFQKQGSSFADKAVFLNHLMVEYKGVIAIASLSVAVVCGLYVKIGVSNY